MTTNEKKDEEMIPKHPPFDQIKPATGIIVLLTIIILFTFTIRGLFGPAKDERQINMEFLTHDMKNATNFCPYLRPYKVYQLKWNQTPCENRTLYYRFIPWIADHLWVRFDQDIIEKLKRKYEQSKPTIEVIVEEPDATHIEQNLTEKLSDTETVEKTVKENKQPEQPTSLVYTILTAITTLLAVLACIEFFKEKINKKPGDDARNDNRRCSLAEFTIKRHQRKESKQENANYQALFDEPKKVKELLHQGSLDRAISILNPPPTGKKATKVLVATCRFLNLIFFKLAPFLFLFLLWL